jgi:hypothetical protein
VRSLGHQQRYCGSNQGRAQSTRKNPVRWSDSNRIGLNEPLREPPARPVQGALTLRRGRLQSQRYAPAKFCECQRRCHSGFHFYRFFENDGDEATVQTVSVEPCNQPSAGIKKAERTY